MQWTSRFFEVVIIASSYEYLSPPPKKERKGSTASQPSTAGPGQSVASASASAHAVDTAAAQQSATAARLPSTVTKVQLSAEHADACGNAAGTAGEHTEGQAAGTDGKDTAIQQQSPGAQQPEQASQIATD